MISTGAGQLVSPQLLVQLCSQHALVFRLLWLKQLSVQLVGMQVPHALGYVERLNGPSLQCGTMPYRLEVLLTILFIKK